MKKKIVLKDAGVILITGLLVFSTVIVTVNAKNMQPNEVWVDDDAPSSWYDGYDHFKKIQEGVDAVAIGGTVNVLDGIYPENVILNKIVNLVGKDKTNTIIDGGIPDITNPKAAVIILNDYVRIAKFRINGGVDGIFIDGCSYCFIGYCEVGWGSLCAIRLDCDQKNCVLTDIEFNEIHSCQYGGINISGWPSDLWWTAIITHNKFTGAHGPHIYLDFCTNYIIQYNNFAGGEKAIVLKDSGKNHIRYNTIAEHTYGIILDDASQNNEIYNNIISGTGIYGIWLNFLGCRNNITNNTISRFNCGIYLTIDSVQNDIFYNNISNNMYGIILDDSILNTIHDNKITSNKFYTSTGGGGYGIVLTTDSNENTIFNNNIVDNGYSGWHGGGGIYLEESDGNTISNNTVSRNNEKGIYIHESSWNSIDCNIISSNSEYGILLCGSFHNTILCNDIFSNKDFGLLTLCYNNHNKMYKNNFINNNINAADDSGPNTLWNDNYWSDYRSNVGYPYNYYLIPGQSGFKDNSPSAIPSFCECLLEELVINKIVNRTGVEIGGKIEYTIHYENPNPFTVHNAFIIDTLPDYLCCDSSTNGGIYDANNHYVIWDIGTLPGYSSGSVTLRVFLCSQYIVIIVHNEAFIYSDETHPVIASADIDFDDPFYNPTIYYIDGVTNGKPGEEYTYTLVATDPNGDDVYYYIDWGDEEITDWFGPYPSGETVTAKHIWNEQGTYTIRAKAKDSYNLKSDWVTLEISMLKIKIINSFEGFLENHPHMFPLLRQLLKLY